MSEYIVTVPKSHFNLLQWDTTPSNTRIKPILGLFMPKNAHTLTTLHFFCVQNLKKKKKTYRPSRFSCQKDKQTFYFFRPNNWIERYQSGGGGCNVTVSNYARVRRSFTMIIVSCISARSKRSKDKGLDFSQIMSKQFKYLAVYEHFLQHKIKNKHRLFQYPKSCEKIYVD